MTSLLLFDQPTQPEDTNRAAPRELRSGDPFPIPSAHRKRRR
jgi:hypothetical protein